jgi:uncharacterized membrane protein YidH (DUF202 family)
MTEADALLGKIASGIINPVIALMFAIAIIFFLYGVVEFIMNSDNEDKRSEGRKHMVWGVIGLFVMLSTFGIMSLLANTASMIGGN